MGVKSGQNVTRAEAEEKYADLRMQDESVRRKFRAEAVAMDDEELQSALTDLNDKTHDGEGFVSFYISSRNWES